MNLVSNSLKFTFKGGIIINVLNERYLKILNIKIKFFKH